MEQGGVHTPGDGGRGDIQGAKADEGKLLRVWSESGGFFPESTHGEATWIQCTPDKGGC